MMGGWGKREYFPEACGRRSSSFYLGVEDNHIVYNMNSQNIIKHSSTRRVHLYYYVCMHYLI